MNPLAYRVLRAPMRSFAFAIFGIFALINASDTVNRLAGPAIAGVFPFLALLLLALTVAYGAWFPREHQETQSPVLRRLATAHVSLGVILFVCVLAAFTPGGGLASAIALALTALSLTGIRDDSTAGPADRSASLPDSMVTLVR